MSTMYPILRNPTQYNQKQVSDTAFYEKKKEKGGIKGIEHYVMLTIQLIYLKLEITEFFIPKLQNVTWKTIWKYLDFCLFFRLE